MQGMREAVAGGAFDSFRASVRAEWEQGDIAPR